MSTPSVDWYEWFDKTKQSLFEAEMKNNFKFILRNGLYKSVYRKWIREKLGCQQTESKIEEDQISKVTKIWLETRGVDTKEYEKEPVKVLESNYMSQELFDKYCENEVLAYKWAYEQWKKIVPQIFLEQKEKYDMAQIKILFVGGEDKGLALEIYQILSEGEKKFNEVGSEFDKIKYSTKPEGNWVRKVDMKNEIRMRVEKMKLADISKPFKVENKYLITQLVDSKGTSLNEEITEKIILNKLNSFLDYGVLQLTELCLQESQTASE